MINSREDDVVSDQHDYESIYSGSTNPNDSLTSEAFHRQLSLRSGSPIYTIEGSDSSSFGDTQSEMNEDCVQAKQL